MEIDRYLIDEFIARCQRAYDICNLHKKLFDENDASGPMKKEPYYSIFGLINHATLEQSLLDIAKLHDPAMQGKNENLSLEYIIEKSQWPTDIRKEITDLKVQLDEQLFSSIKSARRKALCHHDIRTILNKKFLGDFPKDADIKYFNILEKFLHIVCQSQFNQRFTFDRWVENHISQFIDHFNRKDIKD